MKSFIRAILLRRQGVLPVIFSLMLVTFFSALVPLPARAQSARTRQVASSDKINKPQKQSKRRWIEIDLSSQRLIAWEGKKRVYSFRVSTGKRATPTLKGSFAVQSKQRTGRMRGEDYNVPDVPYVMYYSGNYAIHGAYWHNRFGRPVSHGCINVPVSQARRLFAWANLGTQVVVHD